MLLNGQPAREMIRKMLVQSMGGSIQKQVESFLEGHNEDFPTRYGVFGSKDLINIWAKETDRRKLRYFHGLIFLQGWASVIESEDNPQWFERVSDLIQLWHSKNPISGVDPSGMAYHDETTAQRLNQLLSFALITNPHVRTETTRLIQCLCDETAEVLLDEEFHSGLNNHGMFQDIALRNFAVVATWADESTRTRAFETSCKRLREYFLHAFTPEGVHIENTPTYHLMVSRSLKSHLEVLSKLDVHDVELESLYDSAANYATHIVLPNGTFPPISDTAKQQLQPGSGNIFTDEYRYAATAGKSGRKPTTTSKVFPKSGYSIYRSDWDDKDATYVLFQSAYNADYHKHSDDLSTIIYAKGQEIITDPGPYSYNYKDPFSKYAYSQFAHNNIVVDNRSTTRTDKHADSVRLLSAKLSGKEFEVIAESGRLTDVLHERKIVVSGESRQESIHVSDELKSDSTHKYSQHWNLAPGLEVVAHGNGFEVYRGEEKLLDAFIETRVPIDLKVISGQTAPSVMGWSFPSFGQKVPANVVKIQFAAQGNISVSTRFELSNFSYVNRGLHSAGKIEWQRYSYERGLNYLETDSSNSTDKTPLVFAFSAMGLMGDFTYNYKSTIDQIPCKAIYILDDFGDQGSYYLLEKKSKQIFDTVQNFVAEKIRENNGSDRPIYFVGSSKGGTAALLHGLLFTGARIFIGAPQSKIGSFVRKPHPNILEYMSGGQSEQHVQYLDEMLYQEKYLQNSAESVTIIVGKADHHYKNHVLPWVDKARQYSTKIELVALDGTPHSEIGKAYRTRLRNELMNSQSTKEMKRQRNIAEVDTMNLNVGAHNVWYDQVSGNLFATCEPQQGTEIAYRLYRDNELINSRGYQGVNFAAWQGLENGRYRVRFFRRSGQSVESHKQTSKWVVIFNSN